MHAAYTVDTLGLPSLTNPSPETDRPARSRFLAAQRRDPPYTGTQNVWQQAQSFVLGPYIAIRAIMDAMASATVCVERRRRPMGKKSTAVSVSGSGESDWVPADHDHPLSRLFEHVNSNQTIGDFLSERTLCRHLFGSSYEYVCEGEKSGNPVELWNLRRNYLSEVPMSPFYPCGAWRYAVPGPFLWYVAAGSLVFDRRSVIWHRFPHPVFPWEGYSPTTAGGKYIDFLNSIIDSRQMAMDHGFTPDVLVKMYGATQSQMDSMVEDLEAKYSGKNRGRRAFAVDGEKAEVEMLTRSPDEMAYPEAYEQATKATLANYGVLSSIAGLTESSSYSAFYAAARQFRELKLNGEAVSVGQCYTKNLALPRFGPDYRITVKLPPLMDPDLRERQNGTLIGANAIKINELRASYDMEPMDGGDVTPEEFKSQIQQQAQQAQMEQQQGHELMMQQQSMAGMGGDEEQLQPDAADPAETNHAQNMMSAGVLASLGVRGGDGGRTAIQKAWTRFTTKTGGVGARNETGTTLYGADAEAALAGGNKPAGGEPVDRTNPDLDAAFGEAPAAKKEPPADPRHNPDLDEAFNPTPVGERPPPSKPAGKGKKAGGNVRTKPVDQLSPEEALSEWRRLGHDDEKLKAPDIRRFNDLNKRVRGMLAGNNGGATAADGAAGGKSGSTSAPTGGTDTDTSHITEAADLDAGYAKRAEELGAKSGRPGDKVSRIVRGTSKQYTEYESGMKYPHYDDSGIRTPHGLAAGAPEQGQAVQPSPAPLPTPQLHPRAIPIAQRAKVQVAKVVPKLKVVASTPGGQQALKDVAKWGQMAADKHADLIAASKNLDRGAARDLFLVILSHLVRSLPVVGGLASGVTAAVGTHLRNQDRKQVQGAVKEHGKASKELENARKRAAKLGVNPDDAGDTSSSSGPASAGITAIPRPKVGGASRGSLPGRIGRKSLASVAIGYAKRVNKSLKQGV